MNFLFNHLYRILSFTSGIRRVDKSAVHNFDYEVCSSNLANSSIDNGLNKTENGKTYNRRHVIKWITNETSAEICGKDFKIFRLTFLRLKQRYKIHWLQKAVLIVKHGGHYKLLSLADYVNGQSIVIISMV